MEGPQAGRPPFLSLYERFCIFSDVIPVEFTHIRKGRSSMREVTLLLHFLGLGLLVTTTVAGWILHRQYKKAQDLKTKAVILKAARPFGLLSPFAMLLMLVTGIGNMHALGVGMLDLGWLSAKLVVFAVAVVVGVVLGIVSRKRGNLVAAMSLGETDPGAETRLASLDTLVAGGYLVLPVLLIAIVYLSVYGRLGGQ
jgi:hypothetical protein